MVTGRTRKTNCLRRCTISADNGVYILTTPTQDDKQEFRVVHAMAIENIWWKNEEGNPEQVIAYFGNVQVHTDLTAALLEAHQIFQDIVDGPCGICEYGITPIVLPHPFDYYLTQVENPNGNT